MRGTGDSGERSLFVPRRSPAQAGGCARETESTAAPHLAQSDYGAQLGSLAQARRDASRGEISWLPRSPSVPPGGCRHMGCPRRPAGHLRQSYFRFCGSLLKNRWVAPFPGELGPRKRRDTLMVSESSEDVRAQRCQRARQSRRAASHPPNQSAAQPNSEELCVSVSVSSVRWRGQAAELLGATAHSGGRKPGRAGTGNELPAGCEEGNGAVAPQIDGNVGIATIFSTSVSRPAKGARRHLTKGRRCGRIRARVAISAFPATGVLQGQVPVHPALALTFWRVLKAKTQRQVPDIFD